MGECSRRVQTAWLPLVAILLTFMENISYGIVSVNVDG